MSISSAPKDVLRVGQLAIRLAEHIQSGDEFKDLWIEGEVVEARTSTAGHIYFTLRDNVGQLRCVLFATQAAQIALTPRDGAKVLTHGWVEFYHRDGRCQIRVDDLRPAGAGDAYLRMEALKRRLTAEGLFALDRKRALPTAPARIGVVTSPIGAVWRDIQTVVARRDPRIELVFSPALVQGSGAVESLIGALDGLSQLRDLDVVIIARGGGAAEDLGPFNDEALVRAIARFARPVVSRRGSRDRHHALRPRRGRARAHTISRCRARRARCARRPGVRGPAAAADLLARARDDRRPPPPSRCRAPAHRAARAACADRRTAAAPR